MDGLTRSKIAYDLNISPHETQVEYEDGKTFKFVFSSDLYKRNFIKKLEENRETINQSLSNRFGFPIRYDMLADLKLYTTIEKRGFLIYQDGEKIECLRNLTLDGNNLMSKI